MPGPEEPADGGTLLRHVIDGEAFGEYEEIWRERIESVTTA
jgi:hypothetical protein